MNLWRWMGGGCVVLGVIVGTVVRGWPGLGGAAMLLALGGWGLLYEREKIAARLAGLAWTTRDFARGWLLSGDIGSGKTSSGIVQLMQQLFRNVPTWGGLCIDEKGVFWETLTQMAAHHDRAEDVLVLEVRPEEADGNWQPKHRFNLVGGSLHSQFHLRAHGDRCRAGARSAKRSRLLQRAGRAAHRERPGSA